MKMLEQWYDTIVAPETISFQRFVESMNQTPEIVPFDITNIIESMAQSGDDRVFDEKDYPIVTPPYPLMWMEFRIPDEYKDMGKAATYSGALIESAKRKRPTKLGEYDPMQPILEQTAYSLNTKNPHTVEKRKKIIAANNLQDTVAAWIQVWTFFVSSKKECMTVGTTINYIADTGAYIPNLDISLSRGGLRISTFDTLQVPCLIAIALTHAKNVKTIEQPVIREIAERRRREKKRYFVYKELTIKPTTKRSGASTPEDRPDKEGYTHAFHMRRGRWRDYTEGNGLFGKWHGRYWWEPHVAGDIKQGAVIKTYRAKGSTS